LKPLDELVQTLRRQAEAGRCLVAAVSIEHVVARLQRTQQVEASDTAARAADHAVVAAVHQRRAVIGLGKLAGHQSDDAAGPMNLY